MLSASAVWKIQNWYEFVSPQGIIRRVVFL